MEGIPPRADADDSVHSVLHVRRLSSADFGGRKASIANSRHSIHPMLDRPGPSRLPVARLCRNRQSRNLLAALYRPLTVDRRQV